MPVTEGPFFLSVRLNFFSPLLLPPLSSFSSSFSSSSSSFFFFFLGGKGKVTNLLSWDGAQLLPLLPEQDSLANSCPYSARSTHTHPQPPPPPPPPAGPEVLPASRTPRRLQGKMERKDVRRGRERLGREVRGRLPPLTLMGNRSQLASLIARADLVAVGRAEAAAEGRAGSCKAGIRGAVPGKRRDRLAESVAAILCTLTGEAVPLNSTGLGSE